MPPGAPSGGLITSRWRSLVLMARYRHWQNLVRGGETAFITTTCLDFNHVLQRPEMKDKMAARIASDHLYYGARLFGFVVMSNHIHLLTGLPKDKDVAWFTQRLKTNSAKELRPLLNASELAGFALQEGLDGRQFWQRSFRSVGVSGEETFNQKLEYMHLNPVRAG